ncbi:Uncharacterised protein [Chlamydia trachomatis]|nr:Uncharacterised protein [Chlamydia trachomatis]
MNIRPGPPSDNSAPPTAIAGIITIAASIAAKVSKNATCFAESIKFSLLLKYDPYITEPFPATDNEKKACPKAKIQSLGSFNPSEFTVKM